MVRFFGPDVMRTLFFVWFLTCSPFTFCKRIEICKQKHVRDDRCTHWQVMTGAEQNRGKQSWSSCVLQLLGIEYQQQLIRSQFHRVLLTILQWRRHAAGQLLVRRRDLCPC